MSDNLDPEIAELMNIEQSGPDFNDLFEDEAPKNNQQAGNAIEDTVSGDVFQKLTTLEQEDAGYFNNSKFYNQVLTGEGEAAKKLHTVLAQFLKAEDPQDRSMFRGRVIPAFWDVAGSIASKLSMNTELPKQTMLRYGVLLPTAISKEQRSMISRIVFHNNTGQPFYYLDEWLLAVASGRVNTSAVDETTKSPKKDVQRLNNMLDKVRGQYEGQLSLIRTKVIEMKSIEDSISDAASTLSLRGNDPVHNTKNPYNENQRRALGQITQATSRLGNMNNDLVRYYNELDRLHKHLKDLQEKSSAAGDANVNTKALTEEFNSVRQMAKMCVGRQGNHFPMAMKQYLRSNILDIATRENIYNIIAEVEHLDQGIFKRTFKQVTNRIVPNIVILPCFGDKGICWEPFERFNRATSRARLAIPLYPKNVKEAVVMALGDLRWQVAKEKAQHYWMEEGLTGWYYQYFSDKKMKGDVREQFILDYILWITKESEGMQKLEREVRDIFWRYLPFPQEVKDNLKTRGFVYAELYKKDQNRAMSDGY